MTSISSYALTAAPRQIVAQAQAALSKAQVELSSGKMADIGLGLGSAAGSYLSLSAQQSKLTAIQSSNATTAATLTASTTALDALRTAASSFLSSLTQASSTGVAAGTLVTTAGSNLDALTSTLNTTVAGQAIFGGLNSGAPPMTAYTTGSSAQSAVSRNYAATFNGQDPSTITEVQMTSYLTGTGSNSFATLFDATNYQTNWSQASSDVPTAQISSTATDTVQTSVSANDTAFRQLAEAYTMVKEYGGTNFSSGAGQAVIAAATQLVSSAVTGLTSAQAGIGLSQSAVSTANDRMTTQIDYLQTQSADMVDVDPSMLSTQISGLQTQIQASYEITSELQQLSLVNYLK
ncbi:MAG: flagellar hook-associated family protein [Janthinobacterium lividum]